MATKKTIKRKQVAAFTADNIDNTAPVKNILYELYQKNSQAYMFYCQNVKQRPMTQSLQNYHFVVPGYPLNSFGDDWDGDLNVDYFEPFPYKSLSPKMITELKYIDQTDPVTDYMKNKIEWQKACHKLKLTATFSNMMQKYESLNEEVVQCPKHIVEMAAHLDSDPDPYFNSSYNWYYAGNGNLQIVCIDWVDYLLYSEFTTVYLSEFNRNEVHPNPEYVACFNCDDDETIFETICSQNIIALRTKYKIFILRIVSEDTKIKIEKIKCCDSELPYSSITFDDHHKNILYATTLDNRLSIINLDRLKARTIKLTGKLTTLIDNWNTVVGCGRGYYAHVSRNSISIYDKRANNVIFVWKDLRNITDEISCNDISVAKHLEGTTSLYFATDHHLFLMDLRLFQDSKPKVVQRWTHGMECVPAYMSYCNFNMNKDIICLSSQWCEDMCLITNYNDRLIMESDLGGVTIPYRPPSILSTLKDAKQNMLCHDLYNPIDGRLCTAITGALIMEQGERYDILMQNSLGDISYHTLFPEHMESFIDDNSAQSLHNWSKNFKLPKKDFEVSSINNIASVWKQLKNSDILEEEGLVYKKRKFNEKDIKDIFDNEEIDIGLQEVWARDSTEIANDESSMALKLYFSEDEDTTIY
ncbi:unnamed protein product [Euphydryas editha]|uniref:Uncharacterized protein n=1 Tax=Euphydryas editha TaxID=104508 RepID=A0AAU9TLU5_EUPED|nr:unnamed protein product [Euphydryas editha]